MSTADPSSRPPAAPSTPSGQPAPGPASPEPVDWSEESAVGEEDPGASLDMAIDPPTAPAPAPAPGPDSPAPPPGR